MENETQKINTDSENLNKSAVNIVEQEDSNLDVAEKAKLERFFKILKAFTPALALLLLMPIIVVVITYGVDKYLGKWAEIISSVVELIITLLFAISLTAFLRFLQKEADTEKLRQSEKQLYERFQKNIDSSLGKSH